MYIGQKLRNRRLELNLTMLQVAKKTGVSEATVSRWESGDIANMKRDKIVALANALQVSPAFIMGWEEESNNKTKSSKSNCVNLTSDEKNLLDNYSQLNNDGKDKAQEYVSDLTTMDKYTETDLKSKLNA